MGRYVTRKRRATGRLGVARARRSGVVSAWEEPSGAPCGDRLERARRLGHSVVGVDSSAGIGAAVQRVVQWSGAKGQKTYDLSHPLLYFTDFGTTTALINDSKIPPDDPAKALTAPAFLMSPQKGGGVRLSVHAEPINAFGAQVDLPKSPPWSETVPVDHALSAVGSKRGEALRSHMPEEEDAQVTVEAHGLPDDGTFVGLVRDHEKVHVKHVREIVKQNIEPWDKAISKFRTGDKSVVGDDEEKAEAAFYESIAFPTAAQMGTLFKNLFRGYGRDFHTTKEGSAPEVAKVAYSPKKKTIHIYWKHPLG